ncbi:hypothetical protein L5515_007361 [Caenorhabditis briggsae]|uniref:Serpentine receptor class gamma n=1 Tax=Caenorhabditis briggsae TaxID=6238 RepID=A0AAE9F4D2_CAEBR|nr:hypothetical protein L5515_007361 [Caenorhabditis briggsae]
MLSTLAMSVNRYTSVIHPVRHKVFWLRHCYKIIIAILIIPMCFVWPVIIGTTSFLPIDGNSVIYYEHKLPWARTTYGRILIAIPTLLFTVYSSFVTSSKLGKLGGRMKKVEHSMNVATVFTAAGFVLTIFFLVSDTVFIRLTSYVRPICELFVLLLKEPSFVLTPYLTLHQYVQLAKMLSTATMSLNRYTSIVHPVHHKTFWIQHCTKILIAVVTIPLLFVWPVAIGTTSFTPFGGTAIINYERVVPWARTSYVRLIVAVPSFCFTLYSTIVTSSKLRKLGGHMKKVEFSMNMATLFTACGFILVVAVQIAYLADSASSMIENMWLTKIILGATQVSYDFYMLSGPVVLLILDKRMRYLIVCCRSSRKSGSRNTTTVVAVQPLPTITNHSGHSSQT